MARVRPEDKAKTDALKKALDKANHKMEQVGEAENSFTEANKKALELEVEVERLKIKLSEAKNISITKFKKFEVYKSDLTKTIAIFLAKEKIKMESLL